MRVRTYGVRMANNKTAHAGVTTGMPAYRLTAFELLNGYFPPMARMVPAMCRVPFS